MSSDEFNGGDRAVAHHRGHATERKTAAHHASVTNQRQLRESPHNRNVPPLTFLQAREVVLGRVRESLQLPAVETVDLLGAHGRVLAEEIAADRDAPPSARSVRDGFAFRAQDARAASKVALEVVGESRAGKPFSGVLGARQAVEIMTGATVPAGADAIVMVEHVEREGSRVWVNGPVEAYQFINGQGCEARKGQVVLEPGLRLDYSGIAVLAS